MVSSLSSCLPAYVLKGKEKKGNKDKDRTVTKSLTEDGERKKKVLEQLGA